MLGLRAAQLHFRHPESRVTVSLFPMVHVGDVQFYHDVHAAAFDHDVILVEGVKSPVARRLTRAYRWLDLERLGLVVQPNLARSDNGGARVVLADLPTREFHDEWSKVPLRLRLTVSIGAPIYGLLQRYLATRHSLAERMCLEDRRSPEEILSWTPYLQRFWACVRDARDARLIGCLAAELEAGGLGNKRIAVVYGAAHMRAVAAALASRGFICSDSLWREVIPL